MAGGPRRRRGDRSRAVPARAGVGRGSERPGRRSGRLARRGHRATEPFPAIVDLLVAVAGETEPDRFDPDMARIIDKARLPVAEDRWFEWDSLLLAGSRWPTNNAAVVEALPRELPEAAPWWVAPEMGPGETPAGDGDRPQVDQARRRGHLRRPERDGRHRPFRRWSSPTGSPSNRPLRPRHVRPSSGRESAKPRWRPGRDPGRG
jgi:hypothetical protein